MSTCLNGEGALSESYFGLNDPVDEISEMMTVSSVAPGELVLTPQDGSRDRTFTWLGADLTAHFTQGEQVLVEASGHNEWETVSNATTFASVFDGLSLGFGTFAPPDLPYGGLTFKLEQQCKVVSGPKSSKTVMALTATAGADEATVKATETVAVGPYQVHNVAIYVDETSLEVMFWEEVTVLGPVTP